MVANGARYVWYRLQLSSSPSITLEHTNKISMGGGGGCEGGGSILLVRVPQSVRRWLALS